MKKEKEEKIEIRKVKESIDVKKRYNKKKVVLERKG